MREIQYKNPFVNMSNGQTVTCPFPLFWDEVVRGGTPKGDQLLEIFFPDALALPEEERRMICVKTDLMMMGNNMIVSVNENSVGEGYFQQYRLASFSAQYTVGAHP